MKYVPQEQEAAQNKRGIWAGTFEEPWNYRRAPRRAEKVDAKGCLIKGNINNKGARLYHLPNGKWYGKTRIDTTKGERWFCSEADAQAAGWTKAKN